MAPTTVHLVLRKPNEVDIDAITNGTTPKPVGITLDTGHDQDALLKDSEGVKRKRDKLVLVDKVWDKETRKYRWPTAVEHPKAPKLDRYVISKANIMTNQRVRSGQYELRIRGKHICAVLREFYKDSDSILYDEDSKLLQGYPTNQMDLDEAKQIFFARDYLFRELHNEMKSDHPDSEKIFELEAARDFILHQWEGEILTLQSLEARRIKFWLLWTLFPPKTIVYTTDDLQQPRAYRTKFTRYVQQSDKSWNFYIHYDYIDSNGRIVGFTTGNKYTPIAEFPDVAQIDSLKAFPFRNHPTADAEKTKLVTRGKKAMELLGRHLREYDGLVLGDLVPQGDRLQRLKFYAHGRVVLDPETMKLMKPVHSLIPNVGNDLRNNLDEEHYLLWNSTIVGFSLEDKEWGGFMVETVKPVDWNHDAFDSLVLSVQQKTFIQDLVKHHGTMKSNEYDDFIKDKGKGLVGLLSGPPGVGKTFTAEAIAETARKPLYKLSSGELGDTPKSVQSKLSEVMKITQLWGAVLLLDEADVFMVRRTKDALTQNAITSIFLRELEYYRGILLLTTNKHDDFDEAFESRIHFYFDYADLDVAARTQIWQGFLRKIQKQGTATVDLKDEEIVELANVDINGRQIKNVLSIAQSVANAREESLTMNIVQLAMGFSQYQLKG